MKFIKKHIEAIGVLIIVALACGVWQGMAVVEEHYRYKTMIEIYEKLEILEETNRYLKFREEGMTRDVSIIFSDMLEGTPNEIPIIDLGDIDFEITE